MAKDKPKHNHSTNVNDTGSHGAPLNPVGALVSYINALLSPNAKSRMLAEEALKGTELYVVLEALQPVEQKFFTVDKAMKQIMQESNHAGDGGNPLEIMNAMETSLKQVLEVSSQEYDDIR